MRDKIESLQILRGLAALLVVFNHVWGQGYISSVFHFERIGGFGVDVFFVISGFIMSYTLREVFDNNKREAISFIIRRCIRVYPAYFIIITPIIVAFFVKAFIHHEYIDVWFLIGNLLLLPSFNQDPNYHMILGVAWTLTYEIFFYVIYALAISISQTRTQVIVRSMTFIAFMVFFVNLLSLQGARLGWVNISYMIGDPLMLNFALGAACYFLKSHYRNVLIDIRVVFVISLLLLLIGMCLSSYQIPRFLSLGLWALIVVILFLFANVAQISNRVLGVLLLLGNASYSIYLIHLAFAKLSDFVIHKYHVNADLSGGVFSVIAIFSGVIFYCLIEKNAIRLLANFVFIKRFNDKIKA